MQHTINIHNWQRELYMLANIYSEIFIVVVEILQYYSHISSAIYS
jgi:hypothetical protein